MSTTTLISQMDQNVERMLKLIEDEDSFAVKAEMYYEKRHELLGLVEDFSIMYRSLVERHDHVRREIRLNIPDDIQSQSSCISEVGSELPSPCTSPDQPPTRYRSGEDSSSLYCESESDASFVVIDHDTVLRRNIYELEVELRGAKEKLRKHHEKTYKCSLTISLNENTEVHLHNPTSYEEVQKDANEKLRLSEDVKELENVRMRQQKEVPKSNICLEVMKQHELREGSIVEQKIPLLEEDIRMVKFKVHDSKKEVAGLREELEKTRTSELLLQHQLRTMTTNATSLKGKLDKEEKEVSKLYDRITRYKSNLIDRDEEIMRLKEAITIANKSLSEEVFMKLQKERSHLEKNLEELVVRCKSLEEDLRRAMTRKEEIKTSLDTEIEQLKKMVSEKNDEVEKLNKSLVAVTRNHSMLVAEKAKVCTKVEELTVEMCSKDDRIDAMCQHLHQLQMELAKLMLKIEGERKMVEELRSTTKVFEMKIKQQQEIIQQGVEEKQEAIRQLCFSLDHYRIGYLRLRDVVVNHERSLVS